MELTNLNILNVFKKKTINEKSLTLLVLTLLPAMFVTKSIEATLIYVVLYLLFIILSTLVTKLLNVLLKENNNKTIMIIVSYVVIATLLAQFIDAINVNFRNDFMFYIYLFPLSSLPYLLNKDNENNGLGKTLVDAIQSVLVLIVILLVTALLREVIGTGAISFGKYLDINFSVSLFPKYAIATFTQNYWALVILGLYLALFQFITNLKKEETK